MCLGPLMPEYNFEHGHAVTFPMLERYVKGLSCVEEVGNFDIFELKETHNIYFKTLKTYHRWNWGEIASVDLG